MAKPSIFARSRSPREGVVAPGDPRALPAGDAGAPQLTGQIARFGAAGLANVGVDLTVYAGLLAIGAPIPFAKAAAFACGTAFAYVANKNWTFRAGKGNARQFAAFAALYAASMAVNVGANSGIIALIGDTLAGRAAAYCGALALSATMNFIGMRAILLAPQSADARAG